jgi:hypothetical protein
MFVLSFKLIILQPTSVCMNEGHVHFSLLKNENLQIMCVLNALSEFV